jgi:hypothetical protein
MNEDSSVDKNAEMDFALLIAELEGDLDSLSGRLESNKKAIERINAGAVDELDYAALGYTLRPGNCGTA